MLVILFKDENNSQNWTTVNGDRLDDISDEVFSQIGIKPESVTGVFNNENDLLVDREVSRAHFNIYHRAYGFNDDDLNRCFKSPAGDICRFIGFLPKNKKYKCRIYNTNTKCYHKATVDYVRRMLAENPVENY